MGPIFVYIEMEEVSIAGSWVKNGDNIHLCTSGIILIEPIKAWVGWLKKEIAGPDGGSIRRAPYAGKAP